MQRARVILWWCALGLITALPLLAGLVVHERDGWYPESDDATIVLLAHDTFSASPPLVGMVSTAGEHLAEPELHHPGPLELYALAPLTSSPLGPALGSALTVMLLALLSSAALCRGLLALGGQALAAAGLVAVGLVIWSMGGDAPLSVWNPYVVVLPFACFVICAAGASAGHRRLLPIVVVTGSFVAQTHLSYVGLVALIGAWTLVVTVSAAIHGSDGWRYHLWAAAAGVVLWTPPVVQQLTGDPGNLGQIWHSLIGGGASSVGLAGLGEFARVLGRPVAGWGPRSDLITVLPATQISDLVFGLVPVILVLALGVRSAMLDRRRELAVVATVAVACTAGALTALRLPLSDGVSYEYYALWMRPLSVSAWLLLTWTAFRLLPARLRRLPFVESGWVPVAVATCTVVVVATVAALPRPGTWSPWAHYRRAAGALAPEVAAAVRDEATYVIHFRGATPYLSTGSAVALAVTHEGGVALVDPGPPTEVFPWGEARRYTGQPVDAALWVVGGAPTVARPEEIPADAVMIARVELFTSSERDRLNAEVERARAVTSGGVALGPRTAERHGQAEQVAVALADPLTAFDDGSLADLASRGLVRVEGLSADDLFTLQRLRDLIVEQSVTVYLAERTNEGGQ